MAQDTIYMNQLAGQAQGLRDVPNMLLGNEPTFADPSSRGSYGGSLVTGSLSGDFTPIPGITGEIVDRGVSTFAPEYAPSSTLCYICVVCLPIPGLSHVCLVRKTDIAI